MQCEDIVKDPRFCVFDISPVVPYVIGIKKDVEIVFVLVNFTTIYQCFCTLKVVTNEKGEAVGEVLTIIC